MGTFHPKNGENKLNHSLALFLKCLDIVYKIRLNEVLLTVNYRRPNETRHRMYTLLVFLLKSMPIPKNIGEDTVRLLNLRDSVKLSCILILLGYFGHAHRFQVPLLGPGLEGVQGGCFSISLNLKHQLYFSKLSLISSALQ